VFIFVSIGTKIILKNQPRNTRIILENKLVRVLLRRCIINHQNHRCLTESYVATDVFTYIVSPRRHHRLHILYMILRDLVILALPAWPAILSGVTTSR